MFSGITYVSTFENPTGFDKRCFHMQIGSMFYTALFYKEEM